MASPEGTPIWYQRIGAMMTAGAVTMGPHEVPGGMHIAMGTDPQGAAFALVGGK